jgi:hypothetical protein
MTISAPRNPLKTVDLLPEPTVVTREQEGTYAKECLLTGPFGARRLGHAERLSIGLIGTYHLIDLAKEWFTAANSFIESEPSRELETDFDKQRHKLLFPDFPGAPIAFSKTLVLEPEFEGKLTLNEVVDLQRLQPEQYAVQLETLIQQRIASILGASERKPDVIAVLLTDEMYETCHVIGNYHQKLRGQAEPEAELQLDLFSDLDKLTVDVDPKSVEPLSHNFRSRLKKIAMNPEYSRPVQIVREQTLRGGRTQNYATRTWNLLTGMYYKSGEQPWILGGLDTKTCFLGISFFHKKTASHDLVLSSMSHLFANDFNSLVLRGEQVAYDYALKAPVLTSDSARRIAERALEEFENARHSPPSRIVVHKTSRFNDQEIRGFQAAFSDARLAFDLVSIIKSPVRLVRRGLYPVPRGTAIVLSDSEALLYTKGFVPELQTYPGSHIPAPFEVLLWSADNG